MIIYNVTINVDEEIHDNWLQWMMTEHIPNVMGCNLFVSHKVLKLIVDDQGHTYSIQYSCRTMNEFDEYQAKYAPKLQQEHNDRYKDKFVAFRTLLEEIT